jgi:ArsR family transcriptional regulator
MQSQTAAALFDCLSSPLRLELFRLLVRHGRSGLVAGEIATALAVPPSNLSFHLKTLTHAELLHVQQEGRFQRYRANLPLMHDVVGFLYSECCSADGSDCDAPDLQRLCVADAGSRKS